MENFVHEDPKGPDVSLGPIYVIDEGLRTHIDWTANVNIFPAFPE